MKGLLFYAVFMISAFAMTAQEATIMGKIVNASGEGIGFATVVLKSAKDSSMVKADLTTETGSFSIKGIGQGNYFLEASFIGFKTQTIGILELVTPTTTVPNIVLVEDATVIEEVQVTATRQIIEVKPDRTIFNVQGTINATGDNGLNLLRKAPGVLVDNNNSISVLGRSGVLLYVDGKRIPLSGDELTNYLQNLTSEQIDKIDIISNPGARYEAQGNAGIIDIRLKKDKNQGFNSTISGNYGHGRYGTANFSGSGNYRIKKWNIFGNAGYGHANYWNKLIFDNYQNGFLLDEENISLFTAKNTNARVGVDYYINKKHTIGILASGISSRGNGTSTNLAYISQANMPSSVDSILFAPNKSNNKRDGGMLNANYAYNADNLKINVDVDYGIYDNYSYNFQPNYYFDPTFTDTISRRITNYNTPVTIEISTAKVDFETNLYGGNLSFGSKVSNVETDNTLLFNEVLGNVETQNNRRSNTFDYSEMVYAGYVNYGRPLGKLFNITGGLRVEKTDARGDLTAFLPELEEEPVDFNYTSYFPNAGLTFSKNPMHVYSVNYGRRINRPDYNVLNPFKEQLSELSFSKGNKFLQPEIVNNIELGYTMHYKYSFKLSYSLTSNQITRLIGPDLEDPRAGFISWDNLATQKLYNFSASLPIDVTKWWSAYVNATVSYTDNQADYGENGIVDVQAGNYNFYQQHTFLLGKGWKGEISGWYSGPGVWGGVFLYDPSYSLNLGIQKKFLNDRMNVRLSFNDITYQSGWSGVSEFNGLRGVGSGNWDSRRGIISVSYDLGNSNVKSRRRSTGLEEESKRVGS